MFMFGPAPIRRTLNHLQTGRFFAKDTLRVMEVHYNLHGKRYQTRDEMKQDYLHILREFYFWEMPRMQYLNPDSHNARILNKLPTSYIRLWFDYSKEVIMDCLNQSHQDTSDRVAKLGNKKEKRLSTLKHNDNKLIVKLKFSKPIMKGYTTLPQIEVKNCDIETFEIEWLRKISAKERDEISQQEIIDKISLDKSTYWLKVGDSYAFSPSNEDVAHMIKCIYRPLDPKLKTGLEYSYVNGPVEIGPPQCPFEKRHELTENIFNPSDDKFRFVSYNILADLYADSDYSRSVLFAHCPTHALELEYRRQLLLKELSGYHADIICLQEVDKKEFNRTYEPYYRIIENHQGVFHTKGGQVSEGVATFFRRDRFELVDSHRTVLSRLIDLHEKMTKEVDADLPKDIAMKIDEPKEDGPAKIPDYSHPILDNLDSGETKELLSRFESLIAKIADNPAAYKRFVSRTTVLQTSLLQVKERPGTFLIVANTHLYFAPDADHIRLLQGCVCVRYIEFLKDYYSKLIISKRLYEDVSNMKLSVIFCGDLNSSPDSGLNTLLQKGHVESNTKDCQSNEDEKLVGLEFNSKLRFSSAYKDIPYTNYTPQFHGCLDYIFYELELLDLDKIIPMPDHADVTAVEGIPSDVFPSDHLALVAELKFK